MKNLLVIAIALASVTAFADQHAAASKDAHKAAMEACKEHHADKKAMDLCVAEKMKATETTTTTTTTTPAKK
jgi:hypothetical protein